MPFIINDLGCCVLRQFCAKFGAKRRYLKKLAIDNQQVTCGGRVLLNPASATTTSEKQITKAFRTFFVYTPVQGSNSKAQIYRVNHNNSNSSIIGHPETSRNKKALSVLPLSRCGERCGPYG